MRSRYINRNASWYGLKSTSIDIDHLLWSSVIKPSPALPIKLETQWPSHGTGSGLKLAHPYLKTIRKLVNRLVQLQPARPSPNMIYKKEKNLISESQCLDLPFTHFLSLALPGFSLPSNDQAVVEAKATAGGDGGRWGKISWRCDGGNSGWLRPSGSGRRIREEELRITYKELRRAWIVLLHLSTHVDNVLCLRSPSILLSSPLANKAMIGSSLRW